MRYPPHFLVGFVALTACGSPPPYSPPLADPGPPITICLSYELFCACTTYPRYDNPPATQPTVDVCDTSWPRTDTRPIHCCLRPSVDDLDIFWCSCGSAECQSGHREVTDCGPASTAAYAAENATRDAGTSPPPDTGNPSSGANGFCQRSNTSSSCQCGASSTLLTGFTRVSTCAVGGGNRVCCRVASSRTPGASTGCQCYGPEYQTSQCLSTTESVRECDGLTYVPPSGTCGCQSDSECVGLCTGYYCDRRSGCGSCGCR